MEMDALSRHNAKLASNGNHQRHHSSGLHRQESKIISSHGRKSHSRAKSEPHVSSDVNLPPPANDGELNLRHYFTTLGLPVGLLPAVLKVFNSMESRIWLVENSLEMMTTDSHLINVVGNFQRITKSDGATRWSEMQQCVDFHMKMAARCWIPTKVCRLLNKFRVQNSELLVFQSHSYLFYSSPVLVHQQAERKSLTTEIWHLLGRTPKLASRER